MKGYFTQCHCYRIIQNSHMDIHSHQLVSCVTHFEVIKELFPIKIDRNYNKRCFRIKFIVIIKHSNDEYAHLVIFFQLNSFLQCL